MYFVVYLAIMIFTLYLHAGLSITLLLQPAERTGWNFFVSLPLILHSVLMATYSCVLLFSQYPAICQATTTNEQFNGWRYKYFMPDPSDPSKKKLKSLFDEGWWRNALNFFKLRTPKHVSATVDMAGEGPKQTSSEMAGGAQLAAAEFGWDGVEYLLQGVIVTPGMESQVSYMLNLKRMMEELVKPGGKVKIQTELDRMSGGAKAAQAGHGHSHGGKECHGHGH